MSKDDLIKFAALMAEPLFTSVCDIITPDGLKMVFGCDACGAEKIDPVVRSYADPEHDLCQKCYNRLRRAASDKEVVRKAEATWQKGHEEFLIAQAENIVDNEERQAFNDQIVSDSLARMCGAPPLTASRFKKRRTGNNENVPVWVGMLEEFRAKAAAAKKDEESEE